MNNYKKILAGVLATSMVLSSSMVALADEGRTTGSGKVEGALSHDVFSVVLPTEETYSGAFDYVMDPLDLLQDANNDKYTGYTFDNASGGSLYFYEFDPVNNAKEYKNESRALTVENKSTKDVKLTVKVTASSVDGITMTASDDFNSGADTDTSLYMALVDIESDGTTEHPHTFDSAGIAYFTTTLNAIEKGTGTTDPEPYIIQWNPIRDAYEYVWNPASAATNTVDKHSFKLTGKCNPVKTAANAHPSREDWLEVLEPGLSPELEIVWTVENPFEVQVVMDNAGLIKVTNCDGTLWDSLILTDSEGEYTLTGNQGTWTVWDDDPKVEKQYQLTSSWVTYLSGRTATATVNLTDGTSSSSIVTFP